MNIFYLDEYPSLIARWAVDKHVSKMAFESSQMLTASHGIPRADGFGYPFPLSVYSHPCTRWVRQSTKHYEFLYTLMLCYCHEYTYRYEKDHYLVRMGITKQLLNRAPSLGTAWCDPPCAMDDTYLIYKLDGSLDTIASYRHYYDVAKRYDRKGRLMHKWKKREKPEWIT